MFALLYDYEKTKEIVSDIVIRFILFLFLFNIISPISKYMKIKQMEHPIKNKITQSIDSCTNWYLAFFSWSNNEKGAVTFLVFLKNTYLKTSIVHHAHTLTNINPFLKEWMECFSLFFAIVTKCVILIWQECLIIQ